MDGLFCFAGSYLVFDSVVYRNSNRWYKECGGVRLTCYKIECFDER